MMLLATLQRDQLIVENALGPTTQVPEVPLYRSAELHMEVWPIVWVCPITYNSRSTSITILEKDLYYKHSSSTVTGNRIDR